MFILIKDDQIATKGVYDAYMSYMYFGSFTGTNVNECKEYFLLDQECKEWTLDRAD